MPYNFDQLIDRKNTNALKCDFLKFVFKTDDVLPMWVADMDFATPPFIIEALRKRLDHEILGYTIRPDSFTKSVIDWVDQRHQWKIKEDWVKYSPGIVPAINISIMGLTKPGDKILVQPPVYFPFFNSVTDNDRQLVYNNLKLTNGKYEIDFDDLDYKLEGAKLLIFCSPHNPVGRVWTREELLKLGNLCVKHNIIILSDEIHSDLILPGFKHLPLASLSNEISQITLTYLAASKTFNVAGLSTSVIISENEKLLKSYNDFLEKTHLRMGNLFGSIALETAYTQGENWLHELNQYLQENIDYVRSYLNTNISQVRLIEPEATYLLWLDFRELGWSEEQTKEFLIKKAKLGFNYGSIFGPGGEGFQRMNIGCPRSTIKKALLQLNEAFKQI